jgi:hypothetical protein
LEEYRYILYTDGHKDETYSHDLEWMKDFINKLFNPYIHKKESLCEVLDTKTKTVVYSKTFEQWKKENVQEQEDKEDFTIEQYKAIKSLERAFKKCSNTNLKFYAEGDSLIVTSTDNKELKELIDTSKSFIF